MKTKKNLLLLLMLLVLPFTLQAETFNVKKYGARGNGKKMDSPAIQKAIDACHKAGGGTVLVPAGTYLSATIVLKDNVTLHLEKDALILGTTDYKAYDNLDPFTEGLGIDVGWALLVAVDAKNVALEGEGAIDGQGSALKERHIKVDTRPEGQRWGLRPFLLCYMSLLPVPLPVAVSVPCQSQSVPSDRKTCTVLFSRCFPCVFPPLLNELFRFEPITHIHEITV